MTVVVRGTSLRRGHTKSCGCLKQELFLARVTTHGMRETPTYTCWANINSRCLNKNRSNYAYYGGRGITVCDRWHRDTPNSFENFLADMGERPTPQHSIDRIDNDGPYSPDNCQWSDLTQQANNKRNCRILTYGDEAKTVAQWARDLDIADNTLRSRVTRGWTDAQALGFERRPSVRE